MQAFMGINPVFWTGVVESRIDPLELERVRVRIAGVHSKELIENDITGEGIPVESLPWAHPGMPCNSASMNGIGETPVGPVEGTWVCGISRDGRTFQNLVYLWTLPGIPQTKAKKEGFNDTEETLKVVDRPSPIGTSPELFPRVDYLKESDVNRLARNKNIDKTIVKKKRDTEDKHVPIANSTATWDEQTTAYATKYPFNRVTETESGHITERDDTPGAERTHDYHRSGTFEEVGPDGTRVQRIVKDDYEIVFSNKFVHIKGTVNIRVEGDASISVKGNVQQQVSEHMNVVVGKTYTVTSGGNMKFVAPRIDLNP